jgi:hypothetical protein
MIQLLYDSIHHCIYNPSETPPMLVVMCVRGRLMCCCEYFHEYLYERRCGSIGMSVAYAPLAIANVVGKADDA